MASTVLYLETPGGVTVAVSSLATLRAERDRVLFRMNDGHVVVDGYASAEAAALAYAAYRDALEVASTAGRSVKAVIPCVLDVAEKAGTAPMQAMLLGTGFSSSAEAAVSFSDNVAKSFADVTMTYISSTQYLLEVGDGTAKATYELLAGTTYDMTYTDGDHTGGDALTLASALTLVNSAAQFMGGDADAPESDPNDVTQPAYYRGRVNNTFWGWDVAEQAWFPVVTV